jgi:hypothetical protein
MLGIVGYEAWGHFRLQQAEATLAALQAKVDQAGADAGAGVTEREVHNALKIAPTGGMQVFEEPRANGAKAMEVYKFPGLIKSRVLYVYYGVQGVGSTEEHRLRDMLTFSQELVKQTQWEKMQEDQKKFATQGTPSRSDMQGMGGGQDGPPDFMKAMMGAPPGGGPGGPGGGPGGPGGPPGGGAGMKMSPPPGFSPESGDKAPDQEKDGDAESEEKPADEPKAEEPNADDPKSEETPAEEPKSEEPEAEEPNAEEPAAEEPKSEDTPAEEPAAEEPKAEEPDAEEPKTNP